MNLRDTGVQTGANVDDLWSYRISGGVFIIIRAVIPHLMNHVPVSGLAGKEVVSHS